MATLATVLENVRLRIEDQTTLTRSKQVDTVRTTPDHLHDKKFSAWPVRSRNTGGIRGSQSAVLVDDEITVELVGRLIGAKEVTALDTALAVAESVRVALTNAAWFRANGLQCVTWEADRHTRDDGWVIIAQTYILKRQGVLG